MNNDKTILAWHFARRDMKTQHTNEAIIEGGTLSATGKIVLCENGMHASLCPLDALKYAPGSMLCRVELFGEIVSGKDKLCATSRKVIWVIDADHLLHEFACLCAERALTQAKVKDERCHNAIRVKRLWLKGKATDGELDAARDAARATAWDAAWDAARAAAWDAARAAARAAACDAEITWQRRTLNALINKQAVKEGKK